jgi:hypothetical protein
MKRSHLLLVVLCGVALPALAEPQCTPKTTRGTWEYTCDGYLPPAQGAPLAAARLLGTCTASDTAYWTCLGSFNVGGFVVQQGQTLKGQANNNADCTGTISYQTAVFGQPGPNLDIQYVIWDDGDRISGLPINSGGVLSCSLHRMSRPFHN